MINYKTKILVYKAKAFMYIYFILLNILSSLNKEENNVFDSQVVCVILSKVFNFKATLSPQTLKKVIRIFKMKIH